MDATGRENRKGQALTSSPLEGTEEGYCGGGGGGDQLAAEDETPQSITEDHWEGETEESTWDSGKLKDSFASMEKKNENSYEKKDKVDPKHERDQMRGRGETPGRAGRTKNVTKRHEKLSSVSTQRDLKGGGNLPEGGEKTFDVRAENMKKTTTEEEKKGGGELTKRPGR